jgi:prepilin-type N-terminal cleavage/methylation domain-containing protein
MNRQKGFTLIELVVVIAVLAILAGVAIPRFINVTDQAKLAAERADVGTIRAGLMNFAAEKAVGTSTTPGTGKLTFPTSLTIDTTAKRAFPEVLDVNSQADFFERGWEVSGTGFKGPAGGVYSYSSTDGSFVKP